MHVVVEMSYLSQISLLFLPTLLHLFTFCESEGYCRFPPFLWETTLHDHSPEGTYRKWYSRTEYIRNTHTWTRQKEIEARPTEIIVHQKYYASCSGYGPPGEIPCYRQSKESRLICIAEEPDGKYRVQQLNGGSQNTFTCLKFVQRTSHIVQIYFAVPNEVNVDKLCYDVALQRDEWPWIDIQNAPIVPCPIQGGFDFRTYTGDFRVERCPSEWRPSRLESECLPGDGLHVIFPEKDCSFTFQAPLEQTLVCRGHWSEESYQFIVLSDTSGPPRYILRLPIDAARQVETSVFGLLYFSLVVPASGRGTPPGNGLYVELRMTQSDTDPCYDEAPDCEKHALEGKCSDTPIYQFANHCKRSCGLCDFIPSSKPECQFRSQYQGNWTLVTSQGLETITLDGGTVQSAMLGRAVCKSKHWNNEFYKLLTVFKNGCRPRYTCLELFSLGHDLIQFRFSNSSLEDESFDLCQFSHDAGVVWKPALLDHQMKTLFNKDLLQLGFCGLGGIFHTNVSFSDGTSCEGTVSDVDHVTCRIHDRLRLSFHSCHSVDVRDFTCVAFTQLPQGTRFLVTRSIDDNERAKYQCWIIKQPDPSRKEGAPTRVVQFNRAKCSTAEILQSQSAQKDILTLKTFNDFVESDCDAYHGAMERLLQGSSTGRSQSVSSSPPYADADGSSWRSYNTYWSHDQATADDDNPAVKRFTTAASSDISRLDTWFSISVCGFVIVTLL